MQDNPLTDALGRVLRPLVRLAIARGLRFRDLSERLKEAYISSAERSFGQDGKRLTDSRLSVLTGLQRKDIKAIRSRGPAQPGAPLAGPLPRLIQIWRSAPEFSGPDGGPLALARNGPGGSFEQLAAQVSTDIHPRWMLDELLRLGLVRETGDGLQLLAEAFVPGRGEAASLGYLGGNLGDHAHAAADNVLAAREPPHFERAVHYNGLTPAALSELEALSRKLQQETLEKIAARAGALQRAARNDPGATGRFRCGAYILSVVSEEAEAGA